MLFALALVLAATASDDRFAPLSWYEGSWLVTGGPVGEPSKLTHLTNRCSSSAQYFACEQIVDGTSEALVVFVRGDRPGTFHSNIIFPSGRSSGRGDITVDGNVITYLGVDETGKPTSRVLNTVRDHDHIHYEIDRPGKDGGWISTMSGDETRVNQGS